MERRINKKIDNYLSEFKENVKEKALELGSNETSLHQLVQYIYDYERFSLVKEDFMKRKRVKNIVHLSDRCCAKRANGEQCTRRRKDETTEFVTKKKKLNLRDIKLRYGHKTFKVLYIILIKHLMCIKLKILCNLRLIQR